MALGIFSFTCAIRIAASLSCRFGIITGYSQRTVTMFVWRTDLKQCYVYMHDPYEANPALSEKKTGVKSARPSSTACLVVPPTNNALCRKCFSISGAQ